MTDFTKPDGYSSWNTIYPVYINSKRTRNEGRRIPVDLCCEDPTINELESVTGYQPDGIFTITMMMCSSLTNFTLSNQKTIQIA